MADDDEAVALLDVDDDVSSRSMLFALTALDDERAAFDDVALRRVALAAERRAVAERRVDDDEEAASSSDEQSSRVDVNHDVICAVRLPLRGAVACSMSLVDALSSSTLMMSCARCLAARRGK